LSTKTLVDEISIKATGWNRAGKNSICNQITRVQNYLFSKPSRVSICLDKTTGDHPFLVTEAGKFEYDIPNTSIVMAGILDPRPLRISMVLEVYTKKQNFSQEYRSVVIDRGDIRPLADRYIIEAYPSEALDDDTPARILFPFDPGDTTDTYQYEALIEPLQILNETVPIMVARNYESMLLDGALGYIEYHDYGRSDRLQTFLELHAPTFWAAYPYAPRRNRNNAHQTPPLRF
jgi:hypothetical protein